MVVFGIVRNHDHPPSRSGAGGTKIFQELPTGNSVELTRFPSKEELAVPQTDGAEVAHTPPGGMVKQNGVFAFRRDPHPAARAVLLEVHFVHSPEINRGVGA